MLANIAGALATFVFWYRLWLKWSTAMSWTAAINGRFFVLFLLPRCDQAIAACLFRDFLAEEGRLLQKR